MNYLRALPKIDKCLSHPLFEGCNSALLMKIARTHIEALRHALLHKEIDSFEEEALMQEIKKAYDKLFDPSLKPLINATGVILHTNMGRSHISNTLLERTSAVICNYSNLEYNREEG